MNKRQSQKISDKIIHSLHKARLDKDIRQYKLAKDLGMGKSTISQIENLKQRPYLFTMLMIADYLEVDLSDIIKQALDK